MISDISSIQDIEIIITKFYEKLLMDEHMRPFFEEILEQDHLKQHIQVIAQFWNDILFDTNEYSENVMQKHLQKNTLIPFKKHHFVRWTSYFLETIDALFLGDTATKMKNRALSIATIMQLKMSAHT